MLIVGNVANRHYNGGHDRALVEVLCLENHMDKVKKALNILGPPMDKDTLSSTYLVAGTRYKIYNSSQLPVIAEIVNTHVDTPEVIRIASPLATFAWSLMMARYRHRYIRDWEENATVASLLYSKYMKYSSERSHRLAKVSAMMLTGCGAMSKGVMLKGHEYKAYIYYTRDSLLDLYSGATGSKYDAMVLSDHENKRNRDTLSKTKFDSYPTDVKIEAIMERLYMDTANEFLLPDMLEKTNSEIAVKMQFKTSIMNLCSQSTNSWFTDYVICSYNRIMEEFDPNCASQLYDAMSLGILDEPAINKIY